MLSINLSKIIVVIILTLVLLIIILFLTILQSNKSPNTNTKTNTNGPPIDIVYCWVDGDDPVWLNKKNKYLENGYEVQLDNNSDIRFKQINELKYSLRSINDYCKYININKIYIVVDDDQSPKFVDFTNPKVVLIKHSQIFKNPNHLPTFNSQSIETNLHRIPGLTEYFLYFNDDMFVGNYITYDKLFDNENGKPLFYYTIINLQQKSVMNTHLYGCINNNKLLKEWVSNYNDEIVNKWHHPNIHSKSFIEYIESIDPWLFEYNSSFRFRNIKQYHLTAFLGILGCYLGYYTFTKPIANRLITFEKEIYHITPSIFVNYYILNNLSYLNKKPFYFCLNNITPMNKYTHIIIRFLESYFPNKSPYELD